MRSKEGKLGQNTALRALDLKPSSVVFGQVRNRLLASYLPTVSFSARRGRFCQHADSVNETSAGAFCIPGMWPVGMLRILGYDCHSMPGTKQPPGKLDFGPQGALRLMHETGKERGGHFHLWPQLGHRPRWHSSKKAFCKRPGRHL